MEVSNARFLTTMMKELDENERDCVGHILVEFGIEVFLQGFPECKFVNMHA